MPNIKSAVKRVKVTKVKTLQNQVKKSELRTTIKKCKSAIADNNTSAAALLKDAVKALDKAAAKNLLHKKTAARKKSRLAKALNAANK